MKFILQIAFLLLSGNIFAQVITVSEPITMRNDIAYYIIGEQKDNVLLFRDKDTEFEVQAYDAGMRMKWDKEIELDKGRARILDVIPGDGDFDVLYKHRRKGHYYLKIHRYDAAANLLDSTTVKDLGSAYSIPKFEMRISEDKRKVLLVDYDRISKFNAMVIDLDSMKVMWEKPFVGKDFFPIRNLDEMLVDNRGNAYIIFNKDNRKVSKADHRLELYTAGPDFSKIGKITIPFPEKLIYHANYIVDNLNKKLVVAGLYSIKNKGRTNGHFYLSANIPEANPITLEFHPFSNEQVSILLDKKIQKNEGVPQMKVQEIVLRRDGGILMITEQVKLNERGGSGSGISQVDSYGNLIVDYFYDNIFVASVHPTGAMHWEEILHKRQFSQDDGASYSSYFLIKTPKNLRMIFNDDIRNENLVSEYIIAPSGSKDRNSVFNTERQNLRLRFRDAVQIASNEIIVPSERKNRIKLVRVTY